MQHPISLYACNHIQQKGSSFWCGFCLWRFWFPTTRMQAASCCCSSALCVTEPQ